MGDKGILLTMTQSGGVQLSPPEGTIFLYVTGNSENNYSIYGACGTSNHLLMSCVPVSSGSMPDLTDGAVFIYQDDALIHQADTVSGSSLGSNVSMYVYTGGVTEDVSLDNLDCSLTVSRGGYASRTTLNNGKMFIHSGGTANSVTVKNELTVYSGGTALNVDYTLWGVYDLTIESGAYVTYTSDYSGVYTAQSRTLVSSQSQADILSGWKNSIYVVGTGVINSATLYGARLYVYSGGTVNNAFATDSGSYIVLKSGGVVNYVSGSEREFNIHIQSGGTANHIEKEANIWVSSGGVANYVSSYGLVYLKSGGVINHIHIGKSFNSSLDIESGASINYGSVVSSKTSVSNGTWNSTLVKDGTLDVYGGVFYDTTVTGGQFTLYGGSASNIACSGSAAVHNGASANSVVIHTNGGFSVNSGCTVSGIVISSGGILNVQSGGSALAVQTMSGASVGMENGSYIEYT